MGSDEKQCQDAPCGSFQKDACPSHCSLEGDKCTEPSCEDLSKEPCIDRVDCQWNDAGKKCARPPCGEYSEAACPEGSYCKWDGEKHKCEVRKCTEYTSEETCPKNCEWTDDICKPVLPFETCTATGEENTNECPENCVFVT